jgi:hypothetical protein
MPDGEWRMCRECLNRGYGVDAWLPLTSQYWPLLHGKLWTGRCRACNEDRRYGKRGIVPAGDMEMAA